MKVTTKVAAGAGLLVGLLLVALAQDVTLIRRLASTHRMLSEDRFTAVTITLELLRSMELVEERLLKLSVTRDPAYRDQLDRLGDEFEAQLSAQQSLSLPDEEQAALGELRKHWQQWRQALSADGDALLVATPPQRDEMRATLLKHTDAVRAQALTLLGTLRTGIEVDVERSEAEARRGERDSRIFATIAVAWGVVFVALVFWSLNGPLSRLIAATRSVAAGRYTKLAATGADELSELARAFDAMVERLDEVDRMKRDFVWTVSHELKTPLSVMQETTQLLADGLAGPLTDKQKRMLELNIDAGARLSGMLSRMLDLSRLEAGAVVYDVRPVPLGSLLRAATKGFEARLQEKRLNLEVTTPDTPVVIHGDAEWLVQVFENLLENAIKFSSPQKNIRVNLEIVDGQPPPSAPTRLSSLFAKGPCAVVRVEDEGPGVPAAAREKIFDRFFQVQTQRRVGAGIGLGLSICRDVAAAHGGGLWVTSGDGVGSCFFVVLPLPLVTSETDASERLNRGTTEDAACAPSG